MAGGRGQVAGPSYLLGTKGHVLGDAGIARLEGGVNVGMVKKTAKHKKHENNVYEDDQEDDSDDSDKNALNDNDTDESDINLRRVFGVDAPGFLLPLPGASHGQ